MKPNIFTLLILLLVINTNAQVRTITGVVNSDEGLPLEGVTVKVKGTNNVSGTQADGVYYIKVGQRDSVIVFIMNEYKPVEVALNSADQYDVRLLRNSFRDPQTTGTQDAEQAETEAPVIIEGRVLFQQTHEPVSQVYLYIIEGEEEFLTDPSGYFKIKTWQKPPIRLHVKYKENPKFHLTIADPLQKQTVWIR
ncbi:MAG: carboxypeptidase-like regulatory domain-containing protein [Chitinophagaceae bacterium]